MKSFKIYTLMIGLVIMTLHASAGNKDRAGQMGATELNLNPWAMTSGLFYANGAYVSGLEAMKLNVAGLARTKGTELGISWNNYLAGTDISFVNGAFAIDIGSDNKLGVNIMSMNFGNPNLATVENPEQDVTFTPSFVNFGLAYSHEFSENVVAGLQATVLSENIGEAKATGVAIDGGIQYVGGNNKNTHFGISLRNVGPTFRFSGDGFNQESTDVNGNPTTQKFPSGNINLPTQFILSGSFDFYPGHRNSEELNTDSVKHKLTPMFSFTSNAYYADHLTAALEYTLNQKFFMRAAYRYESKIFDKDDAQTLYSGLAIGLGLNFLMDKDEGSRPLQFDYAFKPTRFGTGMHSISLKYLIN